MAKWTVYYEYFLEIFSLVYSNIYGPCGKTHFKTNVSGLIDSKITAVIITFYGSEKLVF